jgi:general secretion pathway protein K
MFKHRPSPTCHRDGFIVVAVLWIMAAFATLALIYSSYVAQSAVALRVNDDALQTEALMASGLELVAYQLSSPAEDQRPTHGSFRFRMGNADVGVEFLTEAARIDLNMASKPLIGGLFAVLGAQPQQAGYYADRVIGWRTRPKPIAPQPNAQPNPQSNAQDNNEDSLYRTAGLGYYPRRAPFNHIGELWLVQGLPPALVERALSFVTVYSGMPEINVLEAPPEVIAALPNMTPARLNAFLAQRETLTADPQLVADSLGKDQAGASTKGSAAVRVHVRVRFQNARQSAAEVVITHDSGAEVPYQVLSWQSDGGISSRTGESGG